MQRLALGFLLLFSSACTTDAERPWVVRDAISSGDMNEAALTEPAPSAPLVEQASFVESDLPSVHTERPASAEPSGLDSLGQEDGFDAAELTSVRFEHSELLPVEPDTLFGDASVSDEHAYLAEEAPFDLSAPTASVSPRPSETLVRVESLVSSAEVWTDGILLGPANEFLTLDPGRHELEIRASGFASVYRQITLVPRAKETIKVDLAPLAH